MRTMLLDFFQGFFRSLCGSAHATIRVYNLRRQQRQLLAHVVMQLSCDSPALFLLRFEQPATEAFLALSQRGFCLSLSRSLPQKSKHGKKLDDNHSTGSNGIFPDSFPDRWFRVQDLTARWKRRFSNVPTAECTR